ncbi:hypothetical protein GCM10009718_00030 [Isoptericola halotolerans]|uniref:Uncharacterized protein n=1 Tax=Isoptericola halotolerans TaxID=300560 RepID=A0ABX2A6B3_9MICO|nr:hypothetical protein [Isoptericola halotolerans]NOV98363.1 hypothetical protein [Isoptericola halotolerans]
MPHDAQEQRASDSVLAPLVGLDDLPTDEHVARFQAVYDGLSAQLDSRATDDGAGD